MDKAKLKSMIFIMKAELAVFLNRSKELNILIDTHINDYKNKCAEYDKGDFVKVKIKYDIDFDDNNFLSVVYRGVRMGEIISVSVNEKDLHVFYCIQIPEFGNKKFTVNESNIIGLA